MEEEVLNSRKPIRRNKFTPEEDILLTKYVSSYGERNWQYVESFLPNRSARQCRERWKYFLSPNTAEVKKKWTPYEDELLLDKYEQYGSKWSKINHFFKGRTDVSIKNRFHLLQRNHLLRSNTIVKKKSFKKKDVEKSGGNTSKGNHGSKTCSPIKLQNYSKKNAHIMNDTNISDKENFRPNEVEVQSYYVANVPDIPSTSKDSNNSYASDDSSSFSSAAPSTIEIGTRFILELPCPISILCESSSNLHKI
ncbi:Myb-like DNA-binding domain containing protein [Tritrichomonas foetus]|uniref:Myb-like DNA-binding domain containing protein n=1 Tax=Tritrichomonas foetus TaxID=1144522 RepID=A0A1J4JJP5_9EUKA|nr:Myb-like DNA-binding domain containing protein [Tritrichomonas foetus]|eukprot:OHS97773.1 Myb-like DNA-binding domain containing protein [Tritrichomonas foetus]